MIRVRIAFGDGDGSGVVYDTYDKYGLIYISSDDVTEAPLKSMDTTEYANEAGEHIDRRAAQNAFDYKVKFAVEGYNKNLDNANAKIDVFNKAMYTTKSGSDIRTFKEVTFYDDYKRVKIVGIPKPVNKPTDFYRKENGQELDCVQFEFTIRVADPRKCDFNLHREGDKRSVRKGKEG